MMKLRETWCWVWYDVASDDTDDNELLRTKLAVLMHYCVNYSFSYALMKSCWKETPAERPRFMKIVTTLTEIISYDAGSTNESAIAPTPYLESIEETANVNQTWGHMIRPNGPVSYIDLSRNVPTSYIELTLDDSSSNVEHTQQWRF